MLVFLVPCNLLILDLLKLFPVLIPLSLRKFPSVGFFLNLRFELLNLGRRVGFVPVVVQFERSLAVFRVYGWRGPSERLSCCRLFNPWAAGLRGLPKHQGFAASCARVLVFSFFVRCEPLVWVVEMADRAFLETIAATTRAFDFAHCGSKDNDKNARI